MNTIILLLLSILPHRVVLRESVDLVELNHYYDGEGRQVFSQWILWDWNYDRFQVVAWRMHKGDFSFREQPPMLIWIDEGRVRQVDGRYWRETWTQSDPELAERETGWKRRELWAKP